MLYHISTYGYTHKMFGCKRTRLDFGKPYWNEKTKNAKVFWTLAFFFVPKFGVPKGIRTLGQELRRLLTDFLAQRQIIFHRIGQRLFSSSTERPWM